jgi:phage gp46-like protein
MSVAQFDGRLYDLSIFQGKKSTGMVRLTQELFGDNSGAICTGIDKLAQRVAIELLTDTSSAPYAGDRGTALLSAVRRGELRTETDVYMAFSLAAARILQLFRSLELDTDPDDERLTELDVVTLQLEPDRLKLTMRIVTQAGDSREVILPITVLP